MDTVENTRTEQQVLADQLMDLDDEKLLDELSKIVASAKEHQPSNEDIDDTAPRILSAIEE